MIRNLIRRVVLRTFRQVFDQRIDKLLTIIALKRRNRENVFKIQCSAVVVHHFQKVIRMYPINFVDCQINRFFDVFETLNDEIIAAAAFLLCIYHENHRIDLI